MPKTLSDFSGDDLRYLRERARPLEEKTVSFGRGKRRKTVTLQAGVCPCKECGHGGMTMNHCDPDADPKHVGCRCCHGTCT